MTEESDDRIKKISEKQDQLEKAVIAAEQFLYEFILGYWGVLRDRPSTFNKYWRMFRGDKWNPLLRQFSMDIEFVLSVNGEYFESAKRTPEFRKLVSKVNGHIMDRFGMGPENEIIKGGYLDSLLNDESAKRALQQFLYRTRARKDDFKLKIEAKELIQGAKEGGGIISRFFDDNVFDTYQEADRMTQNDYAQELGMQAAIYIGGIIRDSRDFCRVRNAKVFTREEIGKFGTPDDQFGGYRNKSIGYFDGKPKTGYDPFLQCGGHRCRHHLSWVAPEVAVMLDATLQNKNDVLTRIEI